MNVPIELDTCLKMATASVFTLRSERDQAMAEGLRDRRELSSMRAERDAFKAKVDAATALAAKWKREWDGAHFDRSLIFARELEAALERTTDAAPGRCEREGDADG